MAFKKSTVRPLLVDGLKNNINLQCVHSDVSIYSDVQSKPVILSTVISQSSVGTSPLLSFISTTFMYTL